MKRIFVRLQTSQRSAPILFELPGDIPVKDILNGLIQSESWEKTEKGTPIEYWLATHDGQRIEESGTLSDAEVKNMDLLVVTTKVNYGSAVQIAADETISKSQGSQAQRNKLPPPNWKKIA